MITNRMKKMNIIMMMILFLLSCADGKKKNDEPPKPEASKDEPVTAFSLLPTSFPSNRPSDRVFIDSKLVANGVINRVVNIKPSYPANGEEDEKSAVSSGYFPSGPGLLFAVENPRKIKAVLINPKGEEQAIEYSPILDSDTKKGRVAVSFTRFRLVFPSKTAGLYKLSLRDADENRKRFNYEITLSTLIEDTTTGGYFKSGGVIPFSYQFAKDSDELKIFEVVVNQDLCPRQDCTVKIDSHSVLQNSLRIVELPALPEKSNKRVSAPSRFAGRLEQATRCDPIVRVSNESTRAAIFVKIPAKCTSTKPWCFKNKTVGSSENSRCEIPQSSLGLGQTYFGFVNAVPKDDKISLLGHVEGFANTSVSGCATVKFKQGDKETPTSECFSSPPVSSVSQESLPDWARNLMREAFFSQIPSFSIP